MPPARERRLNEEASLEFNGVAASQRRPLRLANNLLVKVAIRPQLVIPKLSCKRIRRARQSYVLSSRTRTFSDSLTYTSQSFSPLLAALGVPSSSVIAASALSPCRSPRRS